MLVRFSLNTQREILWSLPRTQIMLTLAEPAGEVDTDILDAQQKWALSSAISAGKLVSESSPAEILEVEKLTKERQAQKEVERLEAQQKYTEQSATVDITTQAEESSKLVASQGHKLLSGKVVSVKKEILNVTDIRLLKMMHALETGNKKRKTVLALLEGRIAEIQAQVAASIADDSNPIQMPKQRRELITYDDDVVELEEKTIEVDLSTNPTMDELFQS